MACSVRSYQIDTINLLPWLVAVLIY